MAIRRPRTPWWQWLLLVVGGVLLALVLAVLVIGFTPLTDGDLAAHPKPAADYAEAMKRADARVAGDASNPAIAAESRSFVRSHGSKTQRSVVLLHGYTNSPAQMKRIAAAYYGAGYNVVVPRLPGHGYADRVNRGLSAITPAMLTAATDDAVDIAAGLGSQVTVLGSSGGGTLAMWAGTQRSDVDEVVAISPLAVPPVLPEWAAAPVSRLGRFVPDVYLWWDHQLKADFATPPYAYPRYSLRSLAAYAGVARATRTMPVRRKSPLETTTLVINEADPAINNIAVDRLGEKLKRASQEYVRIVLPASLGWKPDLISPEGENAARIEEIYKRLSVPLHLPGLV